MTWPCHLSKKRLICLIVVLSSCAAFWFSTRAFGVPQVRSIVVADMRVPANATHYCSCSVYAPFIVIADYGWHGGTLSGDGGRDLYFWFFGSATRIRELKHWAE